MPEWISKVVLVTGAGQGCGRAIAEDFAGRGASVVVNDINPEGGRETVRRIEAASGTATFIQADVSVEAEVAGLVDGAVQTYGRLDVAVNNAGTELPVAIAESDAAGFAAVFATNLEGMRACLKHEIRVMRGSGGGSIVNMSSVSSDLTAAPRNGLYGATKGRRRRYHQGGSCGGGQRRHQHQRAGLYRRRRRERDVPALSGRDRLAPRPDPLGNSRGTAAVRGRVVRAVRYLASEEARFMTGTTVVLDGGFTAL
jgi:NAD(P)-dependent dehydrogenase (short-subunit alcohol dehydrogenase family)